MTYELFPKSGKAYFMGQMMERKDIERIKLGGLPEKWERLGIKRLKQP